MLQNTNRLLRTVEDAGPYKQIVTFRVECCKIQIDNIKKYKDDKFIQIVGTGVLDGPFGRKRIYVTFREGINMGFPKIKDFWGVFPFPTF